MSLTTSAVAMMLPVQDVDRARTFYSESLGLDYTGTDDEGSATYSLDGSTTLHLLPRPDSRPTGSTAMSFEVSDVATEVTELESRGVTFEDYDLPGLTTVDHIAEMGDHKAAWFKDPDGNVICLHQVAG
jgi:catechol 2,3-dioxygenase-like lactoylglutathione lyase family enzyme